MAVAGTNGLVRATYSVYPGRRLAIDRSSMGTPETRRSSTVITSALNSPIAPSPLSAATNAIPHHTHASPK